MLPPAVAALPVIAAGCVAEHMKSETIKVSPAGAGTILRFILEETLQKPFFREGKAGKIRQLAEKAAPEPARSPLTPEDATRSFGFP